MARISIWISSIRISPKGDTWHASPIWTSSGRSTRHSQTSHPDDRHITSGRPTYPIRICFFGSLTKVSKSYYVISTACHDPRFATCRVKGQEWWQVTSYDLWQLRRLPQSLSAALWVMIVLPPPRGIMTSQNISLPLKRETKLLIRYIYEPSHKEEGKLAIPSKRPTDLSLFPWLTKPSEGVSGHPVRTPFAGMTEPGIYIGWDRASIHLTTMWITRDTRPQQLCVDILPLWDPHHFFLMSKAIWKTKILLIIFFQSHFSLVCISHIDFTSFGHLYLFMGYSFNFYIFMS